jgi:hypothetical protein
LFCYATFELDLAVAVEALDLGGGRGRCFVGTFVTALSATVGLPIANRLASKV